MVRFLTPEQYMQVVNEQHADYCDCCGGLFDIAGIEQDPQMMPDESGQFLQGGYTVCRLCSSHCEEGPCRPDNLVIVRDSQAEE